MARVDVKKAYDSVDHRCRHDIMEFHHFPYWLCRVITHLDPIPVGTLR